VYRIICFGLFRQILSIWFGSSFLYGWWGWRTEQHIMQRSKPLSASSMRYKYCNCLCRYMVFYIRLLASTRFIYMSDMGFILCFSGNLTSLSYMSVPTIRELVSASIYTLPYCLTSLRWNQDFVLQSFWLLLSN